MAGLLASAKAKLALLILGVAVVGGTAYAAVYVPNRPQNVLKSSVANTLKKDQQSLKGTASFSGQNSPAVTLSYTLQNDSTKPAAGGQLNLSVSGVQVPLEFRSIDKAFYVKVGDLSTIKSLASGFGGAEAGQAINQIAGKVSNKWIEFDESLIKSASKSDCEVFNTRANDEQINQIAGVYEKNQFAIVKNSSSDNVDGRKVTKYELGLDKQKAKQFAEDFKNTELFKMIQACTGNQANKSESAAEDFKGNVELTMWVDKGKKELVKLAVKVSDEQGTLDADFTFNNDLVNITKPEGATPAVQVLGDLGALFGGGASTGSSGRSGNGLSQECMTAFQKYSQSQGRASIPSSCLQ